MCAYVGQRPQARRAGKLAKYGITIALIAALVLATLSDQTVPKPLIVVLLFEEQGAAPNTRLLW